MYLDTEIERKIELGSRYNFDPMSEGRCLVNEQMASQLSVEQGDFIYIKMDIYQNLIALIDGYNNDVAIPKNLPQISRSVVTQGSDNQRVELPCKVTYIGDQSYGKFPKEAVSEQIIMEYKTFLPLLSRFLPSGALNDNQRFKEYLITYNDTKIYELADFMMMTLPSPRVSFYSSNNYWDIQRGVT